MEKVTIVKVGGAIVEDTSNWHSSLQILPPYQERKYWYTAEADALLK